MASPVPPPFVEKKPAPELRERLYNGRRMTVFECKVRVANIKGWIDNPRIDILKKEKQAQVGDRELTQDEIYDIMKESDEIKLDELRNDIQKNGLREPLTLDYDGKLLDGNRRFFALKYAIECTPADSPNRQDLEVVSAYVLLDSATEIDKRNVLVEENFSASLKIEWPEYVKAEMVLQESKAGAKLEEIAKKFGWPKTKVKTALRIGEIMDEFMMFATADKDPEVPTGGGLGLTEMEAEKLCSKNYQFFNESQKSFYEQLKTDIDFKIQFFKWVASGKFSSFQEVRIAYKAWKDPEIKDIISGTKPTAAKKAKAAIDYKQFNANLGEVNDRIVKFAKYLQTLQAEEISKISPETRKEIGDALSLILQYAETNK